MSRLTKDQWMKIAEASAASHYGEKYAGWFMFRRFMAGPVGIATGALVLSVTGYLALTHLHLPRMTGGGHLPVAFWVVVVGLALVTAFTFRPGRIVPAAAIIVRGALFALLWLGVASYGFFALI